MHEALRHRLLGRWAIFVTRRPWVTLAVTVALALLATWYTTFHLGFQSDRNELVSHELEWNKRFLDWIHHFEGTQDMVVVVDVHNELDGDAAGRLARGQAWMDEVGSRLLRSDFINAEKGGVVWRLNNREASPRAVRLLPQDQFLRRMEQLQQAQPVIASPTPGQLLAAVMAQMQAGDQQDQMTEAQAIAGLHEIRRMVDAFEQVATAPPEVPIDLGALVEAGDNAEPQWSYLASDNGRLLFMRVSPSRAAGELNAYAPAIAGIRQTMVDVSKEYPDVDAGLTGIEVVEADETEAATFDATVASSVAFVLIAAMLMLAYHSIQGPALAMGALLVGLAWTFGFTTLVIGHLQVLSVIFATMLLGISDAYGVHLLAKYELNRHEHPDDLPGFFHAIRECFQTMGPGIITGALTTTAAFITTCFTSFTGVAEMGLISGAGILLCLLAMFTTYPALIRIFKPYHRHVKPMEDRWVNFYSDRWVMPFVRHPRVTLVFAVVLTAVSLAAVSRMSFDYDLLKLQPKGADSVDWALRISKDGGQSIYTGVSLAPNLDEARRRAEAFRKLPTVERVGGVGLLFPDDEPQKLSIIRETRQKLGLPSVSTPDAAELPADAGAASAGDLLKQASSMRMALRFAGLRKMEEPVRAEMSQLSASLDRLTASADVWPPQERDQRLAALQKAYDHWRQRIVAALDDRPLTAADLPGEIMRPYLATSPDDGRVLIEVFPRLPDAKATGIDNALHPDFLPGFIQQMRTVDPNITGVIAQVYESGDLIKNAYLRAGVISLFIVFAMLWFDFRSITFALMSLAPVAMGFAVTFGLMWTLGMSINPANIIVLPLMFGIAVDSGVHILHRYRQDPQSKPPGLTHGTGKAITITALTTIVGFATLIPGRHRGISSLGFVLTVGLTLTLLACLAVMPACLQLLQSRRERSQKPGV